MSGIPNERTAADDKLESLQHILAYNERTVGNRGTVLSRTEKSEMRNRHGFCLECIGKPIQLYDVKKSRLNPLWVSKKPRDVQRECAGGVCFVCHPDQDPRRRRSRNRMPPRSDFRGEREQSGDASATSASSSSGAMGTAATPDDSNGRRNVADNNSVPIIDAQVHPVSPGTLSTLSSQADRRGHIRPDHRATETQRSTSDGSQTGHLHESPHSGSPRRSKTKWAGVYVPPVMHESFGESDRQEVSLEFDDSRNPLPLSMHEEGLMENGERSIPMLNDFSQEACTKFNRFSDHPTDPTPIDASPPGAMTTDDDSFSGQPLLPDRPKQIDTDGANDRKPALPAHTDSSTESISKAEAEDVIHRIEIFVNEMKGSDSSDLLVESLLGAMRGYIASSTVQVHCLGVLASICKEAPANRFAILDAGGVEDVLCSMKTHPKDIHLQESACNAIPSICGNPSVPDDSASAGVCPVRAAFASAGVCKLLLTCLQTFVDTESVAGAVIRAMRALSTDPQSRDGFQCIQTSKYVAMAMTVHRSCISIQRDGCAFLTNVAVNIKLQMVTTVPKEELDTIVQAMAHHRTESSVIRGACFALKNYTHEEANCRTLHSCDLVYDMIDLAAQLHNYPDCVTDAANTHERLQLSLIMDESLEDTVCTELRETVDAKFHTHQAVISILNFMEEYDWSARVTLLCLELCHELTARRSSEAKIQDIFGDDDIRGIIRCGSRHTKTSIVREFFEFLASITASNKLRTKDQLNVEVCRLVIRNIKDADSDATLIESGLKTLLHLLEADEVRIKLKSKAPLLVGVISKHPNSDEVQSLGTILVSRLEAQR